MQYILAIETSCDETALAWIIYDQDNNNLCLQDHIVYSQISEHTAYGGVVPGLAARLHAKKLPTMLQEFIQKNGRHIDYIAVTVGPGLEPSLHIGVNQANLLATILDIPIIPVNHMHGHMWSGLLDADHCVNKPTDYPFLAVTISGGHTEMVLVQGYNQYQIVGETLDDAAGESFDKVARMMDLPYPGGPEISKLANHGDRDAINFPRPMIHSGDGHMSFSGLKTAVRYYIGDHSPLKEDHKSDIAASFEQAVIDVLIAKIAWACDTYQISRIILGGGVTANQSLRHQVEEYFSLKGIEVIFPPRMLSTDNAIMIGIVAGLDLMHGVTDRPIEVNGNLSI